MAYGIVICTEITLMNKKNSLHLQGSTVYEGGRQVNAKMPFSDEEMDKEKATEEKA